MFYFLSNAPTMKMFLLVIYIVFLQQLVIAQAENMTSKQNEKTAVESYQFFISKGEEALDRQEFEKALDFYRKANELRSTDAFSIQMIKNLGNVIAVVTENEKKHSDLKRKAEINLSFDSAASALSQKKYSIAHSIYVHILTLNPVASQREFAMKRIDALELILQSAMTAKGSTSKGSQSNIAEQPVANHSNPMAEQSNSIDVKTKLDALQNQNNLKRRESDTNNFRSTTGEDQRFKTAAGLSKTNNAAHQKETKKNTEPVIVSGKQVATQKPNSRTYAIPKKSEIIKNGPQIKSNVKTSVPVKNPTIVTKSNYSYLMNEALKAINLKNYAVAKGFFQKILNLNDPQVDKNAIKLAIKSIDEVLGSRYKTPSH